jgi:hypothetical protein
MVRTSPRTTQVTSDHHKPAAKQHHTQAKYLAPGTFTPITPKPRLAFKKMGKQMNDITTAPSARNDAELLQVFYSGGDARKRVTVEAGYNSTLENFAGPVWRSHASRVFVDGNPAAAHAVDAPLFTRQGATLTADLSMNPEITCTTVLNAILEEGFMRVSADGDKNGGMIYIFERIPSEEGAEESLMEECSKED